MDKDINNKKKGQENNTKKQTTKQKKRHQKKSKETEGDIINSNVSIKKFLVQESKKDMNVPTPSSTKKQSPLSATKPQPKRLNMNNVEMHAEKNANSTKLNPSEGQHMEESQDDSNSSWDEMDSEEEETTKATKSQVVLSPELLLLKDILWSKLKSDLDTSIETKLGPLQTSINNINSLLNSDTSSRSTNKNIKELERSNENLWIQCDRIQKENSALKFRVRKLECSMKENNLIFTGLIEGPWEKSATTYDKVCHAISSVMSGNNKERSKKARI